jgi:hypothetical protein
MLGVDVGLHYFNKNSMHVKNEHEFSTTSQPSILDQLHVNVPSQHKKKYVYFFSIYHLLTHGHPTINYEDMPSSFHMLKVKYVSWKHWSDSLSWGMVEVMHDVLLKATKAAFARANFIVVSADEVTTINNTQWLSIQLYMVQGWKNIPIFLCVKSIGVFATTNNFLD